MSLSVALHEVRRGRHIVLSDIAFTAQNNSFTAVIGRNGCGKSTLVSCIASLIPYTGEISLDGTSLPAMSPQKRASRIAVMLQQLRTPHITVRDLAVFGRSPYLGIGGRLTAADEQRIQNALALAELTEIADCYLDRISGGELRRAYLGMVLAQDGDILVLDEPTANMDSDHNAQFVNKLCRLRDSGKTVIAVMHDLTQAMKADRIVLLNQGKQLFSGTPGDFVSSGFSESVFHAYPVVMPDGEVFFSVK